MAKKDSYNEVGDVHAGVGVFGSHLAFLSIANDHWGKDRTRTKGLKQPLWIERRNPRGA